MHIGRSVVMARPGWRGTGRSNVNSYARRIRGAGVGGGGYRGTEKSVKDGDAYRRLVGPAFEVAKRTKPDSSGEIVDSPNVTGSSGSGKIEHREVERDGGRIRIGVRGRTSPS